MKSLLVSSVQLCLILFFVASCLADSPPKQPKRSKSSYAIMPVLRVGRRSMSLYSQKKGEPLLTPFMRTGRGDSTEIVIPEEDNGAKKRTGSGSSGLWFGPRLGRVQKRNEYKNPWTYIIVDEPPQSEDYFPVDGEEFNA